MKPKLLILGLLLIIIAFIGMFYPYYFTNTNITGIPLPDGYIAPLYDDPHLKSLKTFIKSRLRRA